MARPQPSRYWRRLRPRPRSPTTQLLFMRTDSRQSGVGSVRAPRGYHKDGEKDLLSPSADQQDHSVNRSGTRSFARGPHSARVPPGDMKLGGLNEMAGSTWRLRPADPHRRGASGDGRVASTSVRFAFPVAPPCEITEDPHLSISTEMGPLDLVHGQRPTAEHSVRCWGNGRRIRHGPAGRWSRAATAKGMPSAICGAAN